MQIFEKHSVKSFGAYRVMEGTVLLEGQGKVHCCWVEDSGGNRKSAFTDVHAASGVADALARQDGRNSAGGDGGEDGGGDGVPGPDAGDGGDGDGGGNGGD